MNNNDYFWKQQHEEYLCISYDKQYKYEAWQPGRWAANRSAIKILYPYLKDVHSAYEVGAGSAAFSLELYKQCGCDISAIDESVEARKYAEQISADMQIPLKYRTGDLFEDTYQADLILSLGVIEHYNPEKQIAFIQKCVELSNKYILIAIPNQGSIIFKNYVAWANRKNNEYEEKHLPLTIEKLANMMCDCGLKIVTINGFQIFLSQKEFWNDTEIEKIPLYVSIKKNLEITQGKWKDFPLMDFSYEDIEQMVSLETQLDAQTRAKYGFMVYVLAEIML